MAKDGYEWDPAKASANRRKHGIRFSEAIIALEDPLSRTMIEPDSNGEPRWVSVGVDANARVLVTVFTMRGALIRIISSRLATPSERRRYQEQ
jgi:uncharacterized DUF497 family protein